MKKQQIMDYKEEYEAMVKRCRELHESGNALTKQQMEVVCPQLKESEDEKIRKELLEEIEFIIPHDDETDSEGLILPSYHARIDRYKSYLEKQKDQKWSPSEGEMSVLYKLCYIGNQITDEDDTDLTRLYQDLKREYFNGHSFENMFSREKQKEQKPESCDCSRDEESYTNGIHHVLMNPEVYGLIKQKPAEQLGGTFTSYDMAKTFTEGQNYVIAHPEKFGLCKPAEWSEEDELMRTTVIQTLEKFGGRGTTGMQINWLKCLPERFNIQPKQEWSEEDEKMLYGIIERGNSEIPKGECGLTSNQVAWLETRFKSLRPYWKPSDEQMKALNKVIHEVSMSLQLKDKLIHLEDELKKLM